MALPCTKTLTAVTLSTLSLACNGTVAAPPPAPSIAISGYGDECDLGHPACRWGLKCRLAEDSSYYGCFLPECGEDLQCVEQGRGEVCLSGECKSTADALSELAGRGARCVTDADCMNFMVCATTSTQDSRRCEYPECYTRTDCGGLGELCIDLECTATACF